MNEYEANKKLEEELNRWNGKASNKPGLYTCPCGNCFIMNYSGMRRQVQKYGSSLWRSCVKERRFGTEEEMTLRKNKQLLD